MAKNRRRWSRAGETLIAPERDNRGHEGHTSHGDGEADDTAAHYASELPHEKGPGNVYNRQEGTERGNEGTDHKDKPYFGVNKQFAII